MALNLADIAILGLPTIGGALLAARVVPAIGKLEALSLGFPLGVGVITWALFLLSLLGLPLQVGIVWAVLLFVSLAPIGFAWLWPSAGRKRLGLPSTLAFKGAARNHAAIGLLLSVALVTGAAVFVSLVFSYGSWDAAAIWAAKGYGISLEQSIFGAETWGEHGLAYPLNLPLLISLFQTVSGDSLPGSKLVYPLFLASAMLGLGSHAMRRVRAAWIVVAGILLLGTTPLVFLHGTIGYANLAFSTYLALGTVWGVEALLHGRKGAYLLSGTMLGFGAWTRAEGVGYVVSIVLIASLAGILTGASRPKFFNWLGPPIVILGPWMLLSADSISGSHLGGAVRGFLPEFLSGQFNLWELYLIPRLFLDRALDSQQWGILFPVLAVVLLLSLPKLYRRAHPEILTLAGVTIVMALIPIGLFYVRSYTRTSDFYQLLNRSFDRAFLPAALIMVYFALRSFDDDEDHPAERSGHSPNTRYQ